MATHFRLRSIAIVIPLAGAILAGCTPPQNKYEAPPPPEVTVAKPVQQTVTLFLEKTGQTEAVEFAEVRSRVRGFIEEIKFEPGQRVKIGEVIYGIEKDTYTAARDSAQASVTAAIAAVSVAEGTVEVQKAEVLRANRDYDRQESLKAQNATSIAEYDAALAARDAAAANLISAQAAVKAAKGEQAQAEAQLKQANLDLGYTDVAAPISGRISKTEIKLGNLVDNGQALASVTNNRFIFVNFTLSDREILQIQKARIAEDPERGAEPEPRDWTAIPVFVRRELDDGYPFIGHLEYFDTKGINAATGTLDLRAAFDNDEEYLFPGLFVHVRIPIAQQENALVVPERAVGRNDVGVFVLVVGEGNKIERRIVETGQKLDGWVVIAKGLEPTDSVVIDGLQRSRPGIEVTPNETPLTTEDSPFLQFEPPDMSEIETYEPGKEQKPFKQNIDESEPVTPAPQPATDGA